MPLYLPSHILNHTCSYTATHPFSPYPSSRPTLPHPTLSHSILPLLSPPPSLHVPDVNGAVLRPYPTLPFLSPSLPPPLSLQVPDVNGAWMESFVRRYEQVDVNLVMGTGNGLITPGTGTCLSPCHPLCDLLHTHTHPLITPCNLSVTSLIHHFSSFQVHPITLYLLHFYIDSYLLCTPIL